MPSCIPRPHAREVSINNTTLGVFAIFLFIHSDALKNGLKSRIHSRHQVSNRSMPAQARSANRSVTMKTVDTIALDASLCQAFCAKSQDFGAKWRLQKGTKMLHLGRNGRIVREISNQDSHPSGLLNETRRGQN